MAMTINPAPNTLALLLTAVKNAQADGQAKDDVPHEQQRGEEQHRAQPRDFFKQVNARALDNLEAWVPELHPSAKKEPNGAWSVSSKALGRNLQERLSYHPDGIQDFGEERKATAIDCVLRYGSARDAIEAAMWLCQKLSIEPSSLGWRGNGHADNSKTDTKSNERPVEMDDDRVIPFPGTYERQAPPPPLEVVDAYELLSKPAPVRRWQVEDWIPADDVTLLGADGGEGKTTLALQLAFCTVWGFPWLGNTVRQGPVIYITAEEPIPEVHYRLEKIQKGIVLTGAPPHPLKIISLADSDAVLAVPAGPGTMQTTPLFDSVAALVRDLKPVLLILDAAADVFGGNEIDRPQVRSFIRILRSVGLANDCAILLLAHPSVDALKTGRGYSGSTHWNNAVRARLYFTTPSIGEGEDKKRDDDVRELERAKSNRAKRGVKMTLRWHDGFFGLERGASRGPLDLAEAKAVFLNLLRSYTKQGRKLSDGPKSGSYAPTMMAREEQGKTIGVARLTQAMNALFSEHRIRVEHEGKPSRPHSRIVEA
jgi:RecA-family ATPase